MKRIVCRFNTPFISKFDPSATVQSCYRKDPQPFVVGWATTADLEASLYRDSQTPTQYHFPSVKSSTAAR